MNSALLRALQPTIISCSAAVILCGLVWAGSAWYARHADTRSQQLQIQSQNSLQAKLQGLQDKQLIGQYAQRYRELQRLGLIGEARRAEWIETLKSASRDLQLADVQYELQPQTIEEVTTPDGNPAQYQIARNTLKFSVFVPGEDRFVQLTEYFEKLAPGVFRYIDCTLTQDTSVGARRGLQAQCVTLWTSFIDLYEGRSTAPVEIRTVSSLPNVPTLGRVLLAPNERGALTVVNSPAGRDSQVSDLRLDGILVRERGTTVWMNGQAQSAPRPPEGLKPGQRIDSTTGQINDTLLPPGQSVRRER